MNSRRQRQLIKPIATVDGSGNGKTGQVGIGRSGGRVKLPPSLRSHGGTGRHAAGREFIGRNVNRLKITNYKPSDQAFVGTVLPLLQTNNGRPKRLFSARTFRATRRKARSARTTNAGVTGRFPFLAWLPFLFIPQSTVAQNLYHAWRKKRAVSRAARDCPKPPNASPMAGSRQ